MLELEEDFSSTPSPRQSGQELRPSVSHYSFVNKQTMIEKTQRIRQFMSASTFDIQGRQHRKAAFQLEITSGVVHRIRLGVTADVK